MMQLKRDQELTDRIPGAHEQDITTKIKASVHVHDHLSI